MCSDEYMSIFYPLVIGGLLIPLLGPHKPRDGGACMHTREVLWSTGGRLMH